jgi:hypothetical protein
MSSRPSTADLVARIDSEVDGIDGLITGPGACDPHRGIRRAWDVPSQENLRRPRLLEYLAVERFQAVG